MNKAGLKTFREKQIKRLENLIGSLESVVHEDSFNAEIASLKKNTLNSTLEIIKLSEASQYSEEAAIRLDSIVSSFEDEVKQLLLDKPIIDFLVKSHPGSLRAL